MNARFLWRRFDDTYNEVWELERTVGELSRQVEELSRRARRREERRARPYQVTRRGGEERRPRRRAVGVMTAHGRRAQVPSPGRQLLGDVSDN